MGCLLAIALTTSTFAQAKKLSDADKLYGLSFFWQEVNYNFAFFHQVPKLDWDKAYREYIPKVLATKTTKEYYDVLRQFCALLEDGHTNVYYPREVRNGLSHLKIRLLSINRRAFVKNVDKSLVKKIPLGSEIVAVNGQPTKDYLKQQVLPYVASSTKYVLWDRGIRWMFYGSKGDKFKLKIKKPSGKTATVELIRDRTGIDWAVKPKKRPLLEFKWLKNKIAYLAINTFSNNNITKEFPKYLPELYKAKGIIIDVRRNGGGNSNNASFVVKHFTEQKMVVGSRWKTREHRAAYKAWGWYVNEELKKDKEYKMSDWAKKSLKYFKKETWYLGDTDKEKNDITAKKIKAPLVVLTSYNTASSAEDFLIYLDNLKRGTWVGQKTFGSTGQPLMMKLPGGGRARVCTKIDTYPDGKEFVGYGIIPHVEVNPSVEDYMKKRDIVLKKGVETLKQKMKNSK